MTTFNIVSWVTDIHCAFIDTLEASDVPMSYIDIAKKIGLKHFDPNNWFAMGIIGELFETKQVEKEPATILETPLSPAAVRTDFSAVLACSFWSGAIDSTNASAIIAGANPVATPRPIFFAALIIFEGFYCRYTFYYCTWNSCGLIVQHMTAGQPIQNTCVC